MFCTQCGVDLDERARFCSQCGHATGLGGQRPNSEPRLTRDMQNKKIAGVCAGFARYMAVDVVLVRVIWLALAFCGAIGLIAYIIAWIIMPKDPVMAGAPATQQV